MFLCKKLLTDTQIVYSYIFEIVSFCLLIVGVFTYIIIMQKKDKSEFCPNFLCLCFQDMLLRLLKDALLAFKRRPLRPLLTPF